MNAKLFASILKSKTTTGLIQVAHNESFDRECVTSKPMAPYGLNYDDLKPVCAMGMYRKIYKERLKTNKL
jgi:hypothetical protein